MFQQSEFEIFFSTPPQSFHYGIYQTNTDIKTFNSLWENRSLPPNELVSTLQWFKIINIELELSLRFVFISQIHIKYFKNKSY